MRLDVTGRRIVVLAGPGDRRDEDLKAIANAVAGRFDHYICRRDDNLRNRTPDEVPRIQAQALRAAGVPDAAISVIPDEQDAIEAALRMGEAGDLLLIFADALVRSWKQITKFKAAAAAPRACAAAPVTAGGAGAISAAKSQSTGGSAASAKAVAAGAAAAGGNGNGVHSSAGGEPDPGFNLEGLIRDERGIRLAPEIDD
jgi:hypothetical protein